MAPEGTALARALTGEELELTSRTPSEVMAELETMGWDPERLAALRADRMRRREPWPFPVAPDLLSQVGFARFAVLLAEARSLLGLDGRVPAPPTTDRPLSRDELRLAAERPPHWG